MSDINANATVTLTVNGKQAQNMLEQLKRQASDLEDKITKAAAAGDKVQLKKLQRELKQTRRQIGQIESATQGGGECIEEIRQSITERVEQDVEGVETLTKRHRTRYGRVEQAV